MQNTFYNHKQIFEGDKFTGQVPVEYSFLYLHAIFVLVGQEFFFFDCE